MPKGLKEILTLRIDPETARMVRLAAQRDGASTSEYLRKLATAAVVRDHTVIRLTAVGRG